MTPTRSVQHPTRPARDRLTAGEARSVTTHPAANSRGDGQELSGNTAFAGARGLCVTCNHAPTCTYVAGAEQPIVLCELFDDFVNTPSGAGISPAVQVARNDANAVSPSVHPSKGLCANCDLSSSCALPRPDSGVWHCEEYR